MSATNSEKSKAAAPAAKVVVKKTRTSLLKLFLRTVYWVAIVGIVSAVLYISADTAMTIYKHSNS